MNGEVKPKIILILKFKFTAPNIFLITIVFSGIEWIVYCQILNGLQWESSEIWVGLDSRYKSDYSTILRLLGSFVVSSVGGGRSFYGILAHIYARFGENHGKLRTTRSISATGDWTRHFPFTSLESRTGQAQKNMGIKLKRYRQ